MQLLKHGKEIEDKIMNDVSRFATDLAHSRLESWLETVMALWETAC